MDTTPKAQEEITNMARTPRTVMTRAVGSFFPTRPAKGII